MSRKLYRIAATHAIGHIGMKDHVGRDDRVDRIGFDDRPLRGDSACGEVAVQLPFCGDLRDVGDRPQRPQPRACRLVRRKRHRPHVEPRIDAADLPDLVAALLAPPLVAD